MAGLSVLVALFGLPSGASELIVQIVSASCALAAILLPESE